MTSPIEPMLLNRRQVADLLGVSERTVFNMEKAGKIKRVPLENRLARYARSDLVKLVEAR